MSANNRRGHSHASRASIMACAIAAALPLSAQAIEEIIVTAKQREQDLQEVPLSISTMNESQLEHARVTELRALAEITPNLVFTSGQGRESPSTLAIRGVAPNTGDIRLQGVSVFLDGVYVGGAVQSLDLTQLQRVEVLRGPQATTFGRQTYAGALNYITKSPRTETLSGVAKMSYSGNDGADEDNWQLTGSVQMPLLADRLWLEIGGTKKVMGAMSERGSLVNRNTANQYYREVDIGREETRSLTAALLFEPTENLSIRLRGIISEDRDGPPLTVALHPQEWAAAGLNVVQRGAGIVTPADAGLLWPADDLVAPSPRAGSCDSIAGRPVKCGVDRDRNFFSSNITYKLNDYQLTYLAGWADDQRWSNSDLYFRGASPDSFFGSAPYNRPVPPSGSPLAKNASFFSAQEQYYTNQSHEFRILSPEGDVLSWRAGLYYFSEKERFYLQTIKSPSNPKGSFRGPQEVENYAVFGGLTYKFTDQWSVELEGRLQREKNRLEECPPGRCQASNARTGTTTEEDDDFLPRITAMYRPNTDMMFYALFSQGTKAGRFNTSISTNFLYVEPEELSNYEIGAKTEWLDGRLKLNGAAYMLDIRDQQFSVVFLDTSVDPPVPRTAYQNIGKSEAWGFELDGAYQFDDRWSAAAGIGYATHEYKNNFYPDDANLRRLFNGEGFEGKTSVNLPEWTAFLSTQYVLPLGAGRDLIFDGNLTYTGDSYADQANLAKVPDITRVNLRSTFATGQWEFAAFVRDLFDNNSPVAGLTNATNTCTYLPSPNPYPNQRCVGVVLDRGREVGAQVNYRF
ncbi:TonB-dependent receptor [Gammaproteobacteria bacterium PRO2]|nr:TonB-dependent receptor [Gammaproteobacteria bacterium]MCL4778445.1 TonB-dependent receptor [Gammaproteobacteria bacterium]MCQ3934045.1 hypothetical protein [Gammaproteobacteria bacterium]MDL1880788.1 TonB-dependent receptor [Gammaproteobacteria bacterium PRO2]